MNNFEIAIVRTLIFASGNSCQSLPQVLFGDKRDIAEHSFMKQLKREIERCMRFIDITLSLLFDALTIINGIMALDWLTIVDV